MSDARLRVVRIEPGAYWVGDETIADARPRHRRPIDQPFWIEAAPTPADAFAAFVCDDGYGRADWWTEAGAVAPPSVDARCERIAAALPPGPVAALAGLTWFEAAALARSTGARLPFESEWEIALSAPGGTVQAPDDLLEWTADVFSPVYWRADFARRGVPWPGVRPGVTVSARGREPGALVRHISARRGLDPAEPRCGLRRVWDSPPAGADVI